MTAPTMVPSETVYGSEKDMPYGDVRYADPGYRDNRKRYPIDTPAHIRAALAYIGMPKNSSKYSLEQLELIKGRIYAAAKQHGIEVAAVAASEAYGTGMARPYMAPALLAGAAPLAPPAAWFTDPRLDAPTKLSIGPDGHIFGHLAQWRVCHVGIGNSCVIAPKSYTQYGLFKIGSLICDDGSEVPVGKIVMGTAHANAQWGVMPARDFYDNTSMTAAVVTVGEDRHGIWLNGALTTDMTPEKIASLRASALSGDWRTINGNLELIAALAVNSPGFPIYRTEAGRAFSLQAVGIVGLDEETVDEDQEFSMSEDQEFTTPPTGIVEERAERFARLKEIEDSLAQQQRQNRFAQLAVMDAEREETTDFRPRSNAWGPASADYLRSMYYGGQMRRVDDVSRAYVATTADEEVVEEVEEVEEVETKPAQRRVSKRR